MALRSLKIGLSSSINNPAALATILLDNIEIASNLSITNTISDPYVFEHTFDATGVHTIKIVMGNDYFDTSVDLNLNINFIELSNSDGTFPPYTYLASGLDVNYRTVDLNDLLTDTIWTSNGFFELTFDINNLITWYDMYQYLLDNQQLGDGSSL